MNLDSYQSCAITWTPGDWQDESLPRVSAEALDPVERSVSTSPEVASAERADHLANRYSQGRLVEINSHSLFSKWFSESGKLVQRLFSMVTELVEDEQGFVVILIGELSRLFCRRSRNI